MRGVLLVFLVIFLVTRSTLAVGLGEHCNNNDNLFCDQGLMCDDQTCVLNKTSCFFTQHLDREMIGQLPTCNDDGTFAAKQCKGDRSTGRCFCYSATGERIFGWDWWRNSEEMNCACSRKRYEMEKSGRHEVTLHCQQNGNFEELQCDDDTCWCADPDTGFITDNTIAVPQHLWTLLPCYNTSSYGTQYLRQCESASHAQRVIRNAFSKRGTTQISFSNIPCHYDGSFGTYGIAEGQAFCSWRDGSRLGPFAAAPNQVGTMDCYCARDQRIFNDNGLTLNLQCNGQGNYANPQDLNGELFCVDRDGFVVSDFYPPGTETVDCNNHLYYMQ
uniref:Putative thyroglobulin type i repeat protein n=1 Tax=Lutzomyia longipalpis TaxID=7200 RepID=A0A7G3AZM0_LUTLO